MKLTVQQFKTVKSLVLNECTNYINGKCIPTGKQCLQINSKTDLCNYFEKSVLPVNKYLYSEIVRDGQGFTKKCEMCGCIFTSSAKNTRFCEECAKKQRRITSKFYARRKRGYMSTK